MCTCEKFKWGAIIRGRGLCYVFTKTKETNPTAGKPLISDYYYYYLDCGSVDRLAAGKGHPGHGAYHGVGRRDRHAKDCCQDHRQGSTELRSDNRKQKRGGLLPARAGSASTRQLHTTNPYPYLSSVSTAKGKHRNLGADCCHDALAEEGQAGHNADAAANQNPGRNLVSDLGRERTVRRNLINHHKRAHLSA